MLALIFAAVVAACSSPAASAPTGGQPQPEPALQGNSPDEAAAKSLEVYRKLVGDDFATLGFQSLDEVAQAKLGRSYQVSLVPLDRLQAYQRGSNPADLLVDSGRVIYEVRVGDAVRSSLEVGPIGALWQGQSFGSPALIQAIVAMKPGDTDFIVWVAALNVYFLASRAEQGLTFTPVFDYTNFGLAAGKPVAAADAFASLVDAAKAVTGEFPN